MTLDQLVGETRYRTELACGLADTILAEVAGLDCLWR